jgi:hypothetical protein
MRCLSAAEYELVHTATASHAKPCGRAMGRKPPQSWEKPERNNIARMLREAEL